MKLVVFDCDSTLSAIEGIDELARLRGPETFEKIEALMRCILAFVVGVINAVIRAIKSLGVTQDVVENDSLKS